MRELFSEDYFSTAKLSDTTLLLAEQAESFVDGESDLAIQITYHLLSAGIFYDKIKHVLPVLLRKIKYHHPLMQDMIEKYCSWLLDLTQYI